MFNSFWPVVYLVIDCKFYKYEGTVAMAQKLSGILSFIPKIEKGQKKLDFKLYLILGHNALLQWCLCQVARVWGPEHELTQSQWY